ncbi:MAG: glycosyltransferase family 4 protein [Rhodospirillaceae bacterium]
MSRILLINYEYPPIGGGGGNATQQTARAFARMGHQVYVLTARCGGLPAVDKDAGVTIRRINAFRRRADRCSVFEMLAFMAAALIAAPPLARQWKIDVALAFFTLPSAPVAWYLKRSNHIPYAISLQGGDVPGFDPGPMRLYHKLTGGWISALWRDAAAVIANSQGLATLARAHDPEATIGMIPAGADLTGIAPKQDYAAHGPVNLLFVGRLVKQKGLDVLIAALAKMELTIKWRLTLVGDGPEWPALAGEAARLGLADRLELRGWVAKEALPEIYRSGDIFVLPSRDEGMANARLEAMAAGLPVVATRVAGTGEVVIQGETGLLVAPGETDGLVTALTALIADQAKREAFGRAGRKRVETTFGWDIVASAWMGVMDQVIAKGVEP